MSKGDRDRTRDRQAYREGWDRIFGQVHHQPHPDPDKLFNVRRNLPKESGVRYLLPGDVGPRDPDGSVE